MYVDMEQSNDELQVFMVAGAGSITKPFTVELTVYVPTRRETTSYMLVNGCDSRDSHEQS